MKPTKIQAKTSTPTDVTRRAFLGIIGYGMLKAVLPNSVFSQNHINLWSPKNDTLSPEEKSKSLKRWVTSDTTPQFSDPHEKNITAVTWNGIRAFHSLAELGVEKIKTAKFIGASYWKRLSDNENLIRMYSVGLGEKRTVFGHACIVSYMYLNSLLENPDSRKLGPADVCVKISENPQAVSPDGEIGTHLDEKLGARELTITKEGEKIFVSVYGLLPKYEADHSSPHYLYAKSIFEHVYANCINELNRIYE
jgi:hypothetical protein